MLIRLSIEKTVSEKVIRDADFRAAVREPGWRDASDELTVTFVGWSESSEMDVVVENRERVFVGWRPDLASDVGTEKYRPRGPDDSPVNRLLFPPSIKIKLPTSQSQKANMGINRASL